jgi:hypothetical protein
MISTLAGGVIWLRLQPNSVLMWPQISRLAVWLLVLFGFGTVLMIFRYVVSYWGFRQAESTLTGGVVPPPRFPRSCTIEIFLMIAVAATTFGGAQLLLSLK